MVCACPCRVQSIVHSVHSVREHRLAVREDDCEKEGVGQKEGVAAAVENMELTGAVRGMEDGVQSVAGDNKGVHRQRRKEEVDNTEGDNVGWRCEVKVVVKDKGR